MPKVSFFLHILPKNHSFGYFVIFFTANFFKPNTWYGGAGIGDGADVGPHRHVVSVDVDV